MSTLANTSLAAADVVDVTVATGQTVILSHSGPIATFCLANNAEVKIYGATTAGGTRLAVPGTVLRLKNPGSAAVNYIVADAA